MEKQAIMTQGFYESCTVSLGPSGFSTVSQGLCVLLLGDTEIFGTEDTTNSLISFLLSQISHVKMLISKDPYLKRKLSMK